MVQPPQSPSSSISPHSAAGQVFSNRPASDSRILPAGRGRFNTGRKPARGKRKVAHPACAFTTPIFATRRLPCRSAELYDLLQIRRPPILVSVLPVVLMPLMDVDDMRRLSCTGLRHVERGLRVDTFFFIGH